MDHALPIKTSHDPLQGYPEDRYRSEEKSNQFIEKSGYTYEDVRNILKVAVHIDIKDNQQDDLFDTEPIYQLTEKTIKNGFINYRSTVSLQEANHVLQWARLHSYMIHRMQAMTLGYARNAQDREAPFGNNLG